MQCRECEIEIDHSALEGVAVCEMCARQWAADEFAPYFDAVADVLTEADLFGG